MKNAHVLGKASAVVMLAAAVPTAHAQVALTSSGRLQEVVVTAQRRRENVQKIPISIAVISGATLQKEAKTTLDQVLNDVPGVQLENSPQGGQIYIRGVGNNGDSNIVDSDVALMFDGVYSGRAELAMANAYDINRIEVLRGPQGTLYGRNATGGVVNILSNDPTFKYGAGLNFQIGNYALRHVDGYVNLPIDDVLALRVSALGEKRNGYYSDGGDSSNVVGARSKLLYKPNDAISALFTFDYLHTMGRGDSSVLDPGLNPSSNKWNTTATYPIAYTVYPDQDNYRFNTYSLNFNWDLGFGTLTLLPAYVHSDRYVATNLFAPGGLTTGGNIVEDQYTGEARLASDADSPIKWVVGTFIMNDDNATPLSQQTESGTYFAELPTQKPVTSRAGFGQITYPVTSSFRLTAGARYNADSKSETYQICTTNTAGTACNGSYYSPATTIHETYDAFTYKAGLEYDMTPSAMVYAQVATGYKAGGVVPFSPPTTYAPEKLRAYEIGEKARFFENRLQIDAEAYRYDYKNYQVSGNAYYPVTDSVPAQYLPTAALTSTVFTGTVMDAETGHNTGLEVESHYQATASDRIDLSLAWIDATYGTLVVANPPGPPGTGGPNPYVLTGRRVANTPDITGNIGYTHTFILPTGTLEFHAQTKLSSGYWTTVDEFYPDARQKAYHRSDADVNYTDNSGLWNIGLWVKNIENGYQSVYDFPFYRVMLTAPRTFGMNFGVKY